MAIGSDDAMPISEAAARIQELSHDAVATTKHHPPENDGARRAVMVKMTDLNAWNYSS